MSVLLESGFMIYFLILNYLDIDYREGDYGFNNFKNF